MTKKLPPPLPPVKTSSGPSYAKDFEYLIHGEIDQDHGSSVNPRTSRFTSNNCQSKSIDSILDSVPRIYSTLNQSTNPLAQTLNTLKLKRKRQIPKTPSNVPPFALHDPFELQTSSSTTNNSTPSIIHSSNKYVHFESSKRPCYPNNSSSSSSPHKHPHRNPSPYSQFCIQEESPSTAQRSPSPTDDSLTSTRKTKVNISIDNHQHSKK